MKTRFKQTEIGMIPEDWELTTLQNASQLLTDGSHFSPKEEHNGTHFIATVKDMEDYAINIENCKHISEEVFNELSKSNCRPEKGDVLFSKDGTMGVCFVFKQDEPIVILSSIALIRPNNKFDPFFLKYYLSDKKTQDFIIAGFSSGSALPRLTLVNLKQIPVVKPDITEQRAIAKILSDLDSKIELNQQMNKTLEAIGRAIFKRWFIDFEFPDEEGKPYKSSGGEMVYNEEFGREISKDWKVVPLNETAEFTRGFSYSGSEKSKVDGEYVFITLNSVKEFGGFKREFSYLTSDRVREKHFVYRGDIIIANTEQTKTGTLLGYPALVEFPWQYKKGKGVFSHHITRVIPKSQNFRHYLYHHLYLNQKNAVKYHTGSVIWALDVGNWSKNEKIVLPPPQVLRTFELILENLFCKISMAHLQAETLSRIRDSLLPKLMSGKIRVPVEAR